MSRPIAAAFRVPGPGRWTRDAARYPRPVTPTLAHVFPRAAVLGFSDATRAYGLLLDHIEWAFVDGWGYMAPRRCAPLRGVRVEDRRAWDRLVETSLELRRRLARSGRVFQRRIWDDELDRWYGRDRPVSVEANSAIERTDPMRLNDSDLVRHIHRCRLNVQRAIRLHHRYDVTPAVAVGDLLAHVAEWTGSPAAAHLGLLSPASLSARSSPDLFAASDGWWIAGSTCDIDELCMAELPDALRAARPLATRAGATADAAARDVASALRAQVPARHRDDFDQLVVDARAVHRLRDERALYCDVWAMGLLRRAVVAAGVRLCEGGLLESPADAVEAEPGELRGLLTRRALTNEATGAGTHRAREATAEVMAERRASRGSADGRAVPDELGEAPWAPIPLEWLPEGAGRTERAFRAFLHAMEQAPPPADTSDVHGLPASPGIHSGRARIIRTAADLARLEAGDIVVAPAASPSLVSAFSLAGALVTDHGGTLSHAALVARELRIPAVVGTGNATSRITEGALIRVDGRSGTVAMVGPGSGRDGQRGTGLIRRDG